MKILIIDIETTGFQPKGRICEVGIVELDIDSGEKKIIFDQVINPNQPDEVLAGSWIVQNGYMTIDEIKSGVDFSEVKEEIQDIINSYPDGATAFNRQFDFRFLENYGITFVKKLPCPMLSATPICKLKKTGKAAHYGGYKWPNAEEAFKFFNPGVEYIEIHRGADDAMHEADIVFKLNKLIHFIK